MIEVYFLFQPIVVMQDRWSISMRHSSEKYSRKERLLRKGEKKLKLLWTHPITAAVFNLGMQCLWTQKGFSTWKPTTQNRF